MGPAHGPDSEANAARPEEKPKIYWSCCASRKTRGDQRIVVERIRRKRKDPIKHQGATDSIASEIIHQLE